MTEDWSKETFQQWWGEDGYYENFSYGVGIERVCEVALNPFFNEDHYALEIGSGGGVFTERMIDKFAELTAIDVIKMPNRFLEFKNFDYRELSNKDVYCTGLKFDKFDFCFSYGTFCHLSNRMVDDYLSSVGSVVKRGGNLIFMLSNFEKIKNDLSDADQYSLGDFISNGHFYQDERTLDLVMDHSQWEVVSRNMIPEHRDIIIHIRKK